MIVVLEVQGTLFGVVVEVDGDLLHRWAQTDLIDLPPTRCKV